MYVEAAFWRPTGLGNRLFPWARAKVFSMKNNCPMLTPSWGHLRGASITRGGIDYTNAFRKILLFDNFKGMPGEINGLKKMQVKNQCKKITLDTLFTANTLHGNDRQLISFSGDKCHVFDDLWEHHAFIKRTLKEAVKNKWLDEIEKFQLPFIAVNVRLGKDFKKTMDVNEFKRDNRSYLQTPLQWYVESLKGIRHYVGNLPAYIVTDGNKDDLGILMAETNNFFCESKSAIGDLLILSRATVLIGSGRSSFSAWASFLGKMPTVTVPGSNLQSFQVSKNIHEHFVGEFDPLDPSELMITSLRKKKESFLKEGSGKA